MKQFVDLTGETPVFSPANKLKHVSLPKNYSVTDLTASGLYEVIENIPYDVDTQDLATLDKPIRDDNARTYTTVEIVAKPDVDVLEIKKATLLLKVRAIKHSLQEGLLSFEGNTFQIDASSKAILTSAVVLNGHMTGAHGGAWTDVANVNVPMNDKTLVDFSIAIGAYHLQVHVQKMTLVAQIAAAVTIDELDAIDETAGWPDNGVIVTFP